MSVEINFKGKVVVVTGSTRGIGFRTAELLASRGASVVINSRKKKNVEKSTSRLRRKGLSVLGVPGDVSDYRFCEQLRKAVIDRFGRIDFLINNAALSSKGLLSETRPEVFRMIYDVNVFGSLYPSLCMMDDIRNAKGGVLFISSLAGITGLPSYSIYSSTKSSIIKLAESLRLELADDEVFVGVNYPGFTENDPSKTTIGFSGEEKLLTKRTDVKVEPLDKTVGAIIRQIEKRKFRSFSSLRGWIFYHLYNLFPELVYLVLKLNRRKIMAME
jgi:short-subunit dehydrogenase